MLDRIKQTVNKYQMFSPGDRVIVAVSGGADSTALLYILNQFAGELQISLKSVHVNHLLRGEASAGDARFVQGVCAGLGIPCAVREINVKVLAKGLSTSKQDAARILRYAILEEEAKEFSANKIALAHHQDDQAETVLLHLLRGSGIDGLSGMLPVRDKLYVRPLLEVSRQEIEAFCVSNSITYRTDATNLEPVYLRNRIRLELIPQLRREYNPALVKSLCKLAGLAREERDFLRLEGSKVFASLVTRESNGAITIEMTRFREIHCALQRRVLIQAWQLISGEQVNLSFDRVEEMLELSLRGSTGQRLELPHQVVCEKSYNNLILRKVTGHNGESQDYSFALQVPGEAQIPGAGMILKAEIFAVNTPFLREPNAVDLDADKIQTPLRVRNRREGDRFFPLGAPGSKKLKDFFIDAKVPRQHRDQIPLVCTDLDAGEAIVWVGGIRLAEPFRPGPGTTRILRLKLVPAVNKFMA